MECRVDSQILITGVYKFIFEYKEFILTPNEQGFISSIKIIKKIDNPEKFYSEIGPDKEGSKLTFHIKSDKEIVDDLISDFQYLESSITFGGNYTKIFWEEPIQEWIPETDDERSKLKILKVEHKREGYPKTPKLLTDKHFIEMIQNKAKYDSLTILQAFYNDGTAFFEDYKYINAFYNFYFVIEDIFGGGNTQNRLIMKSFKSSDKLREIIQWVMDNHIKTHKKHSHKIKEFLDDMKLTDSVDDIIEFLVFTRGRLHHFTRKSTLKIGTPFNQRDYESIAFLAMGIALRAILEEILKINLQLQEK